MIFSENPIDSDVASCLLFEGRSQSSFFKVAIWIVKSSSIKAARPHTVSRQWALFKTDSDCSIVPCVCSVVCMLIKCLLTEIAIVALQASSLFHQARVSTALLNPIPANTWSLDKRPDAACTSVWYLLFSLQSPNLAAIPLKKHPLFRSSIADPNTKRTHTFLAGNHAEPAGTFRHLSFHFELEMGLCSVFQAAGAGNTLRVPSGKNSIISISRRHCPGTQSSRPKWKNVVSFEQFGSCAWFFFWKEWVITDGMSKGWKITEALNSLLFFWGEKKPIFDTYAAVDSKLILQQFMHFFFGEGRDKRKSLLWVCVLMENPRQIALWQLQSDTHTHTVSFSCLHHLHPSFPTPPPQAT